MVPTEVTNYEKRFRAHNGNFVSAQTSVYQRPLVAREGVQYYSIRPCPGRLAGLARCDTGTTGEASGRNLAPKV